MTLTITHSRKVSITVKYHGPTSTHGSRVSAKSSNGHRVIIPFDYECESAFDKAARALCEKMEWSGALLRSGDNGKSAIYLFMPAD